ncbi:MAG: putative transporter ATP-binding protein [Firmicutes bacterium]|nr:putative transporter ATP-binding protein [Bacillota bacterium]
MQAVVKGDLMPVTVARPSLRDQFSVVLQLLYTDYRAQAPFLIITSLFLPLGIVWIIRQYAGSGPVTTWLLAGNMVLAVSYGSLTFALWRSAALRLTGEINFYGALPISQIVFVVSIFTVSLLSTLPPLLAAGAIGRWMLGIPIGRLFLAIPLALLAAATLSLFGIAIGSLCRTMEQVQTLTQLTTLVVTICSPVVLPLEKLPLPLKVTSFLLPPGQATIALADSLAGNFGLRFWVMTGSLVAWLAVCTYLAAKRLDWRAK